MSGHKFLVVMLGVLAAAGVMVGVIFLLGFFAYEAGLGVATQPVAEEVPEDPPATVASATAPATSPGQLLDMPLEMNVPARHLSNDGYIAQFQNTSEKTLRVVITVESDRAHTSRTEALEIAPGATIELGWDRGWKLEARDRVGATSDGFKAKGWELPAF